MRNHPTVHLHHVLYLRTFEHKYTLSFPRAIQIVLSPQKARHADMGKKEAQTRDANANGTKNGGMKYSQDEAGEIRRASFWLGGPAGEWASPCPIRITTSVRGEQLGCEPASDPGTHSATASLEGNHHTRGKSRSERRSACSIYGGLNGMQALARGGLLGRAKFKKFCSKSVHSKCEFVT